ncbi:MAG TPA: biopolymer transporter ExbD, partial [bacterium]|nr:biopolymer transporter ExbD [bacterium]
EGGDDEIGPLELNLTALMDILSNILFFLLASFGAAVISVVSASVPVASTGDSDVAKTTDEVNMTVNIRRDGFHVTAGSETLDPSVLGTMKIDIPRTAHKPKESPKALLNELDFDKLTAHLAMVKSKYPKSETVILVPEPAIQYDEVVGAMDAARELASKDANGHVQKRLLFGKVVVSTTIQ